MAAHDADFPHEEVLEKFAVQVVAALGGRINQHWLVKCRGELMVLRLWSKTAEDIDYEVDILTRIAALGWPVARVAEGPYLIRNQVWCLFPYLPGEPPSVVDPIAEQRARGRLLAQFHADLNKLTGVRQRGNWRRCEEILSDQSLDYLLSDQEKKRPEEVQLLRWHLERARERVAGMQLVNRQGILVHGDFTPWNLRYQEGRLSGLLDFELAHIDHRVGDFALSWRGKYDQIIHGYDEVSPLEPEEWELLTPMWWAGLIDLACSHLADGTQDDGWIMKKLLERSPLMGRDANAFP
ncbi:phosphotransferase enzyme family protein [Paenibacillus mendelii]|uniref:Phosphotransferase enzyme family protein n=1 Tax=Paenibacillus mendelii TaxID=206163 RepID=A0ABV6J2B1_9BACL|nr:phosphotransferase [Paenibacillus mendelii]MCQ6562865.1 phosphotransferase [Paenibacillus mendelii]